MEDKNKEEVDFSEDQKEALYKIASECFRIAFGKEFSMEDIKSFFEVMEKKASLISANDLDYSKRLFRIGVADLEASKILFERGLISFSIYHLQQCIEKITKAYFLINGFITKEDLYGREGVGHETPKVLTISLRDDDWKSNFSLFFKIHGVKNDETDKQVKNIENIFKKPEEIMRVNASEIKKVIEALKFNYKVLKRVSTRDMKHRAGLFKHSILLRLPSIFGEELLEGFEETLTALEKSPKGMVESQFLLINLYMLSVITFPHFMFTRYPKDKVNDLEPLDYISSLGIVGAYREVVKQVENIIKGMGRSFFRNGSANLH